MRRMFQSYFCCLSPFLLRQESMHSVVVRVGLEMRRPGFKYPLNSKVIGLIALSLSLSQAQPNLSDRDTVTVDKGALDSLWEGHDKYVLKQ